ncbi:hypothetical protein BIW11_08949 [Tropilaelaps mercedesae]|uniref:Chitin-binding type-2 domain-containing protein n=1 Tax=Tropilaelaps mercedesae TaxID=418985 RepID=A0A1V9XM70_9ACAR|nr:hypothetical protein BIW11_08949 [Tropilaelaps mercedesae]
MHAGIVTLILFGAGTLGFRCASKEGLFPNPSDCASFYLCSHWEPYLYNCSANLYYDRRLRLCQWPEKADCSSSEEATTFYATEPSTTIDSAPTTIESETVSTESSIKYTDFETTADNFYDEPSSATIHIDQVGEEKQHACAQPTDVSNSSALYWQKWRYGDVMPYSALHAGEQIVETVDKRLIKQYTEIVKVVRNGTSHIGATLGPSRFTNQGIYYLHNGELAQVYNEPVWVLCVHSAYKDNVHWIPWSSSELCPPPNAFSSDEFLLARALHHPREGFYVAGGATPREPLITAFQNLQSNDHYDVLCAVNSFATKKEATEPRWPMRRRPT